MPAPPSRASDPGARRTRDSGFSLVEIIVAFAIFAALASAIATISLDSLRVAGDNRERVRAASLAAEEIERVRAQFRSAPGSVKVQPESCLTRGGLLNEAGEPIVAADLGMRYQIDCQSGWIDQAGNELAGRAAGALLRVEVSVRWPGLAAGRPAVINTTVLS